MKTNWMQRDGGRLAFSDEGRGPLVVCVPGMGDLRDEYRFLAARMVDAGFRVVALDIRGHGESSVGWDDLSAKAIGEDVLALIHHLGEDDALVVGTSMAAAAAAWAAVREPAAVRGVVMIGAVVRDSGPAWMKVIMPPLMRVLLARPWGVGFWMSYWKSLFPSEKPADFEDYAARLRANLKEPGRRAALKSMMLGAPVAGIAEHLNEVACPALVVMGTKDRDFQDPAGEAAWVADRVRGQAELVEGSGHYPHVEFPEHTNRIITDFALSLSRSGAVVAS